MTHADPRRPLVLDTRELGRRPGQMLELQRTVEAPEDMGTDVIAVPKGQPIELDLRLESVMEGVYVSGSARVRATGACVRCLDPVHIPVDVDLQELFAYADRAAHHQEVASDDDEDETRELDGDFADLEPVLLDTVVPALPFQPVCREDCPGLCSECGARLADDPDHHHETLDPRWGVLAAISDQVAPDDEKKRN
ncbi:YceD family protein [Luteipulveratus mongoliensis]|uniref:Metal-binding protein n=1 Tax=Luteipulveratus mongoliensis TaxID=571913 RepID=A0A0K1JI18_9MICO|nr:YceD family protein [Luteipulveratus mongoliensis]AKU16364.1 metal-binding protein [Luteipulveratus mongoliensis]